VCVRAHIEYARKYRDKTGKQKENDPERMEEIKK
jgi:hypothetical protein